MGQLLFPEFDRELSLSQPTTSGEFLGRFFEELDQIAEENGLTPPVSTFGDGREVPEGFDGDPDELEEVLGPRTDWHDSKDGVAALKETLKLLRGRPDLQGRFGKFDVFEGVAEELEDLARQLDAAAARGARFRLKLC